LSYAPTANGKLETNSDYTIRFALSCARLSLELCHSGRYSGRRNPHFGRIEFGQSLHLKSSLSLSALQLRGRRPRGFAITLRRLRGFAPLRRTPNQTPVCESAERLPEPALAARFFR